MQEEVYKTFSSNTDAQLHLKRLKYLEDESEELRKSNLLLQLENFELARRLESTQIIANSVLEDPEVIYLFTYSIHHRDHHYSLILILQDCILNIFFMMSYVADRCIERRE